MLMVKVERGKKKSENVTTRLFYLTQERAGVWQIRAYGLGVWFVFFCLSVCFYLSVCRLSMCALIRRLILSYVLPVLNVKRIPLRLCIPNLREREALLYFSRPIAVKPLLAC